MRAIRLLIVFALVVLSVYCANTAVQQKLEAIEELQAQLQQERAELLSSLQSQDMEMSSDAESFTSGVTVIQPPMDRCINADGTVVIDDNGASTTERLSNNTPVKLWARTDDSRFKIGYNRWVRGANLKMKCDAAPPAGGCPSTATSCGLNVPFMSQHSNPYGSGNAGPSNTCQLTTACMVVNYKKAGACRPSDWYSLRQNVKSNSGAASLIKRLLGFGWYTGTGTRDQIKTAIRAGYPLYVNTYLTSGGHVVLIVGYDSRGFYFNDPWGQYNNGYVNYNAAKSWLIPYSQLTSGVLGRDGDIWLATGDNKPVNLPFGTKI